MRSRMNPFRDILKGCVIGTSLFLTAACIGHFVSIYLERRKLERTLTVCKRVVMPIALTVCLTDVFERFAYEVSQKWQWISFLLPFVAFHWGVSMEVSRRLGSALLLHPFAFRNARLVRLLLRWGANPNYTFAKHDCNLFRETETLVGFTPLMAVAKHMHGSDCVDVINALIHNGADPHRFCTLFHARGTQQCENTALMVSVIFANVIATKMFLRCRTGLNLYDWKYLVHGNTQLFEDDRREARMHIAALLLNAARYAPNSWIRPFGLPNFFVGVVAKRCRLKYEETIVRLYTLLLVLLRRRRDVATTFARLDAHGTWIEVINRTQ